MGCLRRVTFFAVLLISQFTVAADCPSFDSSLSVGMSNASNCTVSGSGSTVQLNFLTGFNDNTEANPVGDNNGSTVGAQRVLSFVRAAQVIANSLISSQVISVDASFVSADDSNNDLIECTSNSAVLGSAGATSNFAYASPPHSDMESNVIYPVALINSILNRDIEPGESDITATFNSDLGQNGCLPSSGWYYGFDQPNRGIAFTTVLLHEMTHGLGFVSLVNPSTGVKASQGRLDDVFSNLLYSETHQTTWNNLTSNQRAANARSGTDLTWSGDFVNAYAQGTLSEGFEDVDNSRTFTASDRVRMYAPSTLDIGSSVSHFSDAIEPDELMEPTYTDAQTDLGIGLYLLRDLGWGVNNGPDLSALPDQYILSGESKTISLDDYVSSGNLVSVEYSIVQCGALLECNLNGDTLAIDADVINGEQNSVVSIQVVDQFGESTREITVSTVQPIEIEVDGQAYEDNDSIQLPSSDSQLGVTSGSGQYRYTLIFNGANVDDLVGLVADGIELLLPDSGEFAGEYTLTITDSETGESLTLQVLRPPRLTWSTLSLLEGDTTQTLSIEGGAAGTVYTFNSELVLITNGQGGAIFTAEALNSPANYNPATVYIESPQIEQIESAQVSISSVYDVQVEDLSLYPSLLHQIQVQDEQSELLINATLQIEIEYALVSELNLQTVIQDVNGEFSIYLPFVSDMTDTDSLQITLDADGYRPFDLLVDDLNTVHIVNLVANTNPIILDGEINVTGDQDIETNPPSVFIEYTDGTIRKLIIEVLSRQQATFGYDVDLDYVTPSTLHISQNSSETQEIDLTDISEDTNFTIELIEITTTEEAESSTGSGSSGSGYLHVYWILLVGFALFRRRCATA